jgi:WD40 repeat protein
MLMCRQAWLALCLALAVAAEPALCQAPPEKPAPRLDLHGDPLPPGTVARLGTVRFRHGSYRAAAAFSPDGTVLAVRTAGRFGGEMLLWEIPSGKEIRRFPIRNTWSGEVAFSPDGKLLAVSDERMVCFHDPATGRLLGQIAGHPEVLVCFAISPDGRLLATAGGERVGGTDYAVRLWDLATGREIRRMLGHRTRVDQVAFSSDGRRLTSCGHDLLAIGPKGPRAVPGSVRVWDTRTGKLLKDVPTQDRALTLAPDGVTLAYVPAPSAPSEGGVLHLLRLGTGKPPRSVASWPRPLIRFCPHARVLALWDESLVLRLVETATGRELRRFEDLHDEAPLCLSGGGRLVATVAYSQRGPGWKIRVWDVATGRQLGPQGEPWDTVPCLAFALGGRMLVSGSRNGVLRAWETASGKELWRQVNHRGTNSALAVSPDGRIVASGGQDRSLQLREVATGRALRPPIKLPGAVSSAGFTLDGKTLAIGSGGSLCLYRTDSWQLAREVRVDRQGFTLVGVSPDGRSWALAKQQDTASQDTRMVVGVWQGNPPRKRSIGPAVPDLCGDLTLSADRRLLASPKIADFSNDGGIDQQICLWEVGTGQAVLRLTMRIAVPAKVLVHNAEVVLPAIAFSPDGRTLAATGQVRTTQPALHVWDLATGKELPPVQGHLGFIESIAFSPDGRWLASGSDDGTVLVWEAPRPHPDKRPLRKSLETLWADLAGNDGAAAYRAMWDLANGPRESLPFLRQHLRPVEELDAAHVGSLIAGLDNPLYAVREKATRELDELGELAEAALRQALASQDVLEGRRRLELLLRKLEAGPTPRQLRALRVTGVLERVGSPEARRLLQALARGAHTAWLTREARASLERLARRAAVP